MATLKSRLEHLEAKTPSDDGTFCLVLHGDTYSARAKTAAAAAYLAEHGRAAVNFFDVVFVSPKPTESAKCPA